jgi:tRNA modification GTPase
MDNDTIYAPATPSGGAIAVVRISGPDAHKVLSAVFRGKEQKQHARLYRGYIEDKSGLVDDVMAACFYAPRSYTGEDMAEIYGHGGRVTLSRVLGALSKNGARLAAPGEFTQRAFLAGKMDLSAAGAVMELIGANSAAAADAALRQLSGGLFERITAIQKKLTDALAIIEAGIEYPEEDIEADIRKDAMPLIDSARLGAQRLADTFASGRMLGSGFGVAIVGRPNVGKSSLFNMLLDKDRAIVTEIPGTTRDVVDDVIIKDGFPVRIIDTAGIRGDADEVEKIGIERARNAAKDADLKFFVIDRSAGITEEDRQIYAALEGSRIAVLNKSDLEAKVTQEQAQEQFGCEAVEVSAATGFGRDALLGAIKLPESGEADDVVVTNERHWQLLNTAAQSLKAAALAFDTADLDCVTIDIKEAWDALGEITGVTATEEIINNIFDTFCLGK